MCYNYNVLQTTRQKYVQQILCSYHARFVTGLYRKIRSNKTWFSNIYENMNFKTSENHNKKFGLKHKQNKSNNSN